MRRYVLVVLVAGLVAAVGATGDETQRKEKGSLAGTWRVTALEVDGKRVPPEAVKDVAFVFTADRVIRKKGGKVESEAGYRLDLSKTPRWMDWTGKENGKDMAIPALYRLEGDTLKLCFRMDYKKKAKAGEPLVRPARLDGGPGSEQVLMVLERQKP
jgi:uncharacterized protein (TIGR03067 family)